MKIILWLYQHHSIHSDRWRTAGHSLKLDFAISGPTDKSVQSPMGPVTPSVVKEYTWPPPPPLLRMATFKASPITVWMNSLMWAHPPAGTPGVSVTPCPIRCHVNHPVTWSVVTPVARLPGPSDKQGAAGDFSVLCGFTPDSTASWCSRQPSAHYYTPNTRADWSTSSSSSSSAGPCRRIWEPRGPRLYLLNLPDLGRNQTVNNCRPYM